MNDKNIIKNIKTTLENMPQSWLKMTTYRLDIYNEELAKTEFLNKFEEIIKSEEVTSEKLSNLPTAFDYIRLGHPLSCVLEWAIAKEKDFAFDNVISFSSQAMPFLAILRKNSLENIKTQIVYKDALPSCFDADIYRDIYGYQFDLVKNDSSNLEKFEGSTILLSEFDEAWNIDLNDKIDFVIGIHSKIGSVVLVNGDKNKSYISEIQHVRRRESIAMTPKDCFEVLKGLAGEEISISSEELAANNKALVDDTIHKTTNSAEGVCFGSSGLSVQYAIMLGLIHNSKDEHPGKDIKFIVPPNCYGGTNDQARRVAACLSNVEVVDMPVDGDQDMVSSIEKVLDEVSKIDAVPFIIAEIPTNPRVEVPDLERLKEVLSKVRTTNSGEESVSPVFILDQTFCPNVKFLGEGDFLSTVKTISYVSGSKFPSGGLCTAGYCVANEKAHSLMKYVQRHLRVCGNEATSFQLEVLSEQMPSMIQRIDDAYKNTRAFVNHIKKELPEAKINFVSEELAAAGFTPSVFSLDLPTKGETEEEREAYKRELNLNLINSMIKEIPEESKYCVSYGQLKGCYWTIPATSTQGTTKEGDKDYIVRVSISPDFDLKHHCEVFSRFCEKSIRG